MTGARPVLREVALGLGAYAAYLAVRRAVLRSEGRRRAQRNAERVIALEQLLGIEVEPRVQRAALRRPRLVHALNAGYAGANVTLGVGWLVLLHRRRDPGFARERRAALAAFLGALPVFLAFPVAPPRTLDGFVDTLALRGVDIEHPFLVRFYNPIAAMPSHHLAFAVVTGGGLAARATSRAGRGAWRAYPPLVALVVVATGNHYVLDVVAGAALGTIARMLTR
ncbi:MAG: phosphatase PAP2 family protein [Thermoleophilia bacterium]|nr:phosphatase PAP2 family protein [Thermoleophilia bacterium]